MDKMESITKHFDKPQSLNGGVARAGLGGSEVYPVQHPALAGAQQVLAGEHIAGVEVGNSPGFTVVPPTPIS